MYIELVNTDTKKDLQITKLCTAFSVTNPIKQKKSLIDQHKPIGFLIRAYNEESTIWSVIEEIVQGWYTFIVVCDDWSTDSTNNIVRNLQKKYKHEADIVLLSHLINRWWWAANKTLFAYAQSNSHENWIQRRVTYDADGQMNIADMKTFERAIDWDCSLEVIIWSRFIEWWSAKNIPFVRKCILQWARVITYIFNWIWLTDVSTWYRMYRSDILEKIHIESDGFTYQNDIVHSMYREWLVYTEIPVHISYTEYSLAKGQSSSNALKILKELFWKSWFYK